MSGQHKGLGEKSQTHFRHAELRRNRFGHEQGWMPKADWTKEKMQAGA
jgi:hypothetical protein